MQRSIKIIYISNSPVIYGGSKALLNLIEGVMELGVEPLVVITYKGEWCNEFKKRNIPYCIIPYRFSVYPSYSSIKNLILFPLRIISTFIYNFVAVNRLIRKAKIFKPEIIHSNFGPIHIGYKASKILKIPHVWHIREYQDQINMHPLFSMSGFIKKLQAPNNYPIAITKGIYNYFSMKDNSITIYDGVMKADSYRFESVKNKYFLFVGAISERKGIQLLINAFIEFAMKYSDYDLYIAGDTSDNNYLIILHNAIKKSGLENRVKFLGYRSDVYDLMSKATALVVPSFSEGFGFITAEAMFNGCLVIGNNTSGTKEQLENGDNIGLAYSGHEELVNILKMVVDNGIESYFPMILRGQQTAVSLYSQEQNTKSIFQLYTTVLKLNFSK